MPPIIKERKIAKLKNNEITHSFSLRKSIIEFIMWVNSLIMLLIIMYCFAFSNEYFHPTQTLNKVIHKK